jgi:hypothetical protein
VCDGGTRVTTWRHLTWIGHTAPVTDRRVQIGVYYGLAVIAGIVSGVLDSRSTEQNVVALVVLIGLGLLASQYRKRAQIGASYTSYLWVVVFLVVWVVTAFSVRGRFL